MAKVRKLKNAPITEAVVDIGVRLSAPQDESAYKRFAERINADYPTQQQRSQVELKVMLGKQSAEHVAKFAGNLFRSEDGIQVVQSRPEGLTFSRLKPYSDWDSMLSEAWRLWAIYREAFAVERVIRISTRFINRLEFTDLKLDFDNYLLIGPRLPQELPQTLSSFSTSVNIPDVAPATLAIVRTLFDVAAVKTTVPVLLDIDVIHECDISPHDDATLRKAVDELRPIKNRAFFGSLTDKAVEIFA